MLGVAAVWVSGSRTGLVAVAVSLAIALVEAVRHWRAARSSRIDIKRVAVIGAVAIVAVARQWWSCCKEPRPTPSLQRGTLGYVPFIGDRGIVNSANELLWERFGYGPAAIEMIKEHPIDGIGVGTFHALVIDYGKTRRLSIREHLNSSQPTTRRAGSGTTSRSSAWSAACRCCGGAWCSR